MRKLNVLSILLLGASCSAMANYSIDPAQENRYGDWMMSDGQFPIDQTRNLLQVTNRCSVNPAWEKHSTFKKEQYNKICNEMGSVAKYNVFQKMITQREHCLKLEIKLNQIQKEELSFDCNIHFNIEALAENNFSEEYYTENFEKFNEKLILIDQRTDCYDQLRSKSWRPPEPLLSQDADNVPNPANRNIASTDSSGWSLGDLFSWGDDDDKVPQVTGRRFSHYSQKQILQICNDNLAQKQAAEIEKVYNCAVNGLAQRPIEANTQVEMRKVDSHLYWDNDTEFELDYGRTELIQAPKGTPFLIASEAKILRMDMEVHNENSDWRNTQDQYERHSSRHYAKHQFERNFTVHSPETYTLAHPGNISSITDQFDFQRDQIIKKCEQPAVHENFNKVMSCVNSHFNNLPTKLSTTDSHGFIAKFVDNDNSSIPLIEIHNPAGVEVFTSPAVVDGYNEAFNFCSSTQVQDLLLDPDGKICLKNNTRNDSSKSAIEVYNVCNQLFNTAVLEEIAGYGDKGDDGSSISNDGRSIAEDDETQGTAADTSPTGDQE